MTKNINEDVVKAVRNAIRKTINKFREHPYYFFTESDIRSYFYCSLYSSRFEKMRDERRIYLVHCEYPTNFRYCKNDLLSLNDPYPLSEKKGDRGNFDIAVLNPDFIDRAKSCEDIINKNVRLLEKRVKYDLALVKKELLFAIEFKYITNNSKNFVKEVEQDNKKLSFATKWGVPAPQAINLVFCNLEYVYIKDIKNAVKSASSDISAVFIQAYYKNDEKITPPVYP